MHPIFWTIVLVSVFISSVGVKRDMWPAAFWYLAVAAIFMFIGISEYHKRKEP